MSETATNRQRKRNALLESGLAVVVCFVSMTVFFSIIFSVPSTAVRFVEIAAFVLAAVVPIEAALYRWDAKRVHLGAVAVGVLSASLVRWQMVSPGLPTSEFVASIAVTATFFLPPVFLPLGFYHLGLPRLRAPVVRWLG